MNDKIDEGPRRRGRPRSTDSSDSAVRSLDRGLDILAMLAESGGLTLTELAARLGRPTSTVHRMLMTLENRDMVENDPQQQVWHVGAQAFRIGSAFMRRTGIVERARPVLQRLMERTGETANLGVVRGNAVLFVGQVETHEMIRAFFPPGSQSPLHASGIGKALLAQRDAAEVAKLTTYGLERFTPQTLTDPAALAVDLDRVRRRGFSVDNEERTLGMRCIAAPVFDGSGAPVAGLSISGPLHRIGDDRVDEMGSAVADAAHDLSRALGARVS